MTVLKDLLYTNTHEWVKVNDGVAFVGVTDYAQKSLGSVVYVEGFLDEEVSQGSECGAIESVKAASDLNAPLSGKVIEVNDEVVDNPELVNSNPYEAWILKIEVSGNYQAELNNLLKPEEYEGICK